MGENGGYEGLALSFPIRRGDIVICAPAGEYGKPRPAVVVQSDLFNPTHASIAVCLITSDESESPLFRVALRSATSNGLGENSQVMVDKVMALPRNRIRKRAGVLSRRDMSQVDSALRLWLDLDSVNESSI